MTEHSSNINTSFMARLAFEKGSFIRWNYHKHVDHTHMFFLVREQRIEEKGKKGDIHTRGALCRKERKKKRKRLVTGDC